VRGSLAGRAIPIDGVDIMQHMAGMAEHFLYVWSDAKVVFPVLS